MCHEHSTKLMWGWKECACHLYLVSFTMAGVILCSSSFFPSFSILSPQFSLPLLLLVVVNQGEVPADMSPSTIGHREQPWATCWQLAAHYPELNYIPCCGRSRYRAPGVALQTPRMDVRAGLDRMSVGQFSKLEGLRVLEHQSEEVNDKLSVLWLKIWNRREGQKQAGIHSGYHQS